MSIASEITRISGKVSDSFDAVVAKGGTVTSRKIADLPTAISSISGGTPVPETRFGVSLSNLLGNVDSSGAWVAANSNNVNLVFTDLVKINNVLFQDFSGTNIASVSFPDLESIGGYSVSVCKERFSNCTKLTSVKADSLLYIGDSQGQNLAESMYAGCSMLALVDMHNLIEIAGGYVTNQMFIFDGHLETADYSSLTRIVGDGSLTPFTCFHMFQDCNRLQNINLDSITYINGQSVMWGMFSGSGLTNIRFPMLQSVSNDALCSTSAGTNDIFYNCSGLTGIHFRIDMQSTVSQMLGFDRKFGATNATVYFDLVGKITVNGVDYIRSEQDSIYTGNVIPDNNRHKTYVAWVNAKITDNNGDEFERSQLLDKGRVPDSNGSSLWGWTDEVESLYTNTRHPSVGDPIRRSNGKVLSGRTISAVTDNVIYTAFDNTTKAEPAVGTTVYSDAGQTVVGTVEAIA